MSVYIVTGKLGGGKTLCAVGLIRDALLAGRMVATNVELWLEHMLSWQSRGAVVYRLPDKLSAESFETIGHGNPDFEEVNGRPVFDEKKNGLIVLDEGGLSMNSRDFRDGGRQDFIKWCIHSRKRGWDIVIIVQHFDTLDKQIRDMFGEHIVYCSRFDRMKLPIFGWLLKLVGMSGMGPGVHVATCRYGQDRDSPIAWRKFFKGADLWFAYDTRQQYYPSDDEAVYQLLTPWHLSGRHQSKREEWKNVVNALWRPYVVAKVGRLSVFFCAMGFGMYAHANWIMDEQALPAGVSSGVEQRAGEPSALASPGGAVPANVPEPIDPWENAHLSTLVKMPNGETLAKFRTAEGERLDLPKEAHFLPYTTCAGVVRFPDRQYRLTCRKSS